MTKNSIYYPRTWSDSYRSELKKVVFFRWSEIHDVDRFLNLLQKRNLTSGKWSRTRKKSETTRKNELVVRGQLNRRRKKIAGWNKTEGQGKIVFRFSLSTEINEIFETHRGTLNGWSHVSNCEFLRFFITLQLTLFRHRWRPSISYGADEKLFAQNTAG